jgi:hypothetical protein
MERRPRSVPESRLSGATPTKAAICWRERIPSSGNSATKTAAVMWPTPGAEQSSRSCVRHKGFAFTAARSARSTSWICVLSQVSQVSQVSQAICARTQVATVGDGGRRWAR